MLGQVHLWMCGEDSVMNAYAQPSVLPDPVQCVVCVILNRDGEWGRVTQVEACPELQWDGQGQPLAAVPLPVCSGSLLSDWPLQNSRFMRRCRHMTLGDMCC